MQERDAILILLTQVACARSSALCVLDCSAGTTSGPGSESGAVLSRLPHLVEVARQRQSGRFAKKAPGRAQQAANFGMSLDRDGLYGAPRLYMSAKKLGLRSHIGAEILVAELGNQVLPETWQPHTIPERPVRLGAAEMASLFRDVPSAVAEAVELSGRLSS